MAVMIKCDACGAEEETDGVMLAAPVMGLPFLRPKLPEGWRRTGVPMPDGERREKELCPDDLKRLWALLGIEVPPDEVCVRCEHSSDMHSGAHGCVDQGGACGCELGPVECLDEGWASDPGPHPGVGHNFAGDEDTCTVSPSCEVTWGQFQALRRGVAP